MYHIKEAMSGLEETWFFSNNTKWFLHSEARKVALHLSKYTQLSGHLKQFLKECDQTGEKKMTAITKAQIIKWHFKWIKASVSIALDFRAFN